MNHKCFVLLFTGFFFISVSVLAATAEAESHILLIAHPKLWSAPRQEAPARATGLEAGRRLKVLQTQEAPGGEVSPAGTWYKVEAGEMTGWMPDAYLAPPAQAIEAEALSVIGTEPVDRFHGIPPEYRPADLVAVGPLYDKQVKARLRQEAARALELMIAAARREEVRLLVVSGYRPWNIQQVLYEKRVREGGLDQKTVAKPGHSEHQLGTAVDLTDGDEEHLLRESFGDTAAGRWLREHAWTYGFAVSFTRHNAPRTGCAAEPWHYRYWGISLARTKQREALGE